MDNEKQKAIDMMEREQIPVTIETLPDALGRLFDGIARIYCYALGKNPIILASVKRVDEPENIQVAKEKFLDMKNKIADFNGNLVVIKRGANFDARLDINRYLDLKRKAESVLDYAINYVNLGLMLQNSDKNNADEYHKIITRNLKEMKNLMQKTRPFLEDWKLFDKDVVYIFETALRDFSLSVSATTKMINDHNNKKKQEEIDGFRKENPEKTIKYEISEKEQERINAINEANALYDELCLDFMRDLEKQYSLSTRDMYETFVNVKFKKFVERFNMPLDNSVSVGQAREAYAQIKNLMDYVSKISENAYTVSVYGEKQ